MAIIAKNQDTLDGLGTYLQRAGLRTSTTGQIERFPEVGAGASAVVVFPDDFEWRAVVSALAEHRRRNPRALPVLVTGTPQRFEALAWSDDDLVPLTVPKPAWGWTILDALRAHLRAASETESDR